VSFIPYLGVELDYSEMKDEEILEQVKHPPLTPLPPITLKHLTPLTPLPPLSHTHLTPLTPYSSHTHTHLTPLTPHSSLTHTHTHTHTHTYLPTEQLLLGSIKDYQLEKKLGDMERAVGVRRQLYEHVLEQVIHNT
jgi:hypothetical protein